MTGILKKTASTLSLFFIFYNVSLFAKGNENRQEIEEDTQLDYIFYKTAEIKMRFSDVIGLDPQISSLQDIVTYIKLPKLYTRLGASPIKGIVLYGPPGTGKTLIAKALAGESGVNIISTTGAAFESRWLGDGPARVRELFKLARKNTPCIIFVDEFDAIAGRRDGIENKWKRPTVTEFLSELDGFNSDLNLGVFFVVASQWRETLFRAADVSRRSAALRGISHDYRQ